MKKHIVIAFVSGLTIMSCAKTEKKPLEIQVDERFEDHIDSLSYAIGLDVAMRLQQQFRDVDLNMLSRGIEDHFKGNDLYLTDKERVAVIKKYNDITAPKYRMDLEKAI